MERAGLASARSIAAHRRAFERRVARLGRTVADLSADLRAPDVVLDRSALPVATDARSVKIPAHAREAGAPLDRVLVWVNDVPLHGRAGLALPEGRTREWQGVVDVPLLPGENKIQVSALDRRGVESLRETVHVVCTAPEKPGALHVVAIGVSKYADARWDLTYAAKDARDLAAALSAERTGYREAKATVIADAEATRERILAAKEALRGSAVEDRVVVFVAGHGLLDEKLDYWFATADVDFARPAARGLPYGELEDLVDGVPARQRLVLIDTCHSGEVEREGLVASAEAAGGDGRVKVRGTRGFAEGHAAGKSVAPDEMLTTLIDLRRGTGASVLTAATGAEFSFESEKWHNGVFTYALLAGLADREADIDRDGSIAVSELHAHVARRVRELTSGAQTPTARVENTANDFALVRTAAGR